MRKFLLAILLIVLAIKGLDDYLFSEKFQAWADKNKAPWTCQFNNIYGQIELMINNYQEAYDLFNRSALRCPDSPTAEIAEFEMAHATELKGRQQDALWLYLGFIEKYPNSPKTKIAQRAVQIIRGGF